jgi:hypothetical protein
VSEFTPFPHIQADETRLHSVTEWSEELLEEKVYEYWEAADRADIMPRAAKAIGRMIAHLGFEVDERFKEKEMNNE